MEAAEVTRRCLAVNECVTLRAAPWRRIVQGTADAGQTVARPCRRVRALARRVGRLTGTGGCVGYVCHPFV